MDRGLDAQSAQTNYLEEQEDTKEERLDTKEERQDTKEQRQDTKEHCAECLAEDLANKAEASEL